jgi:galactokinase
MTGTQGAPTGQATSLFRERFGSQPTALVSAPGRVNLLGEHTDYNGGPVLPFAIARRTAIAVALAPGWEFTTTVDPAVVPFGLEGPLPAGGGAYVAAAARILHREGLSLPGVRFAVASQVPLGGGLSSSAALTVAAIRAMAALAGRKLTLKTVADFAYQAEHDLVGVACGRMDQWIVSLGRPGHAILLETATMESHHVPLPGDVWVFDTGRRHQLTGGHLNARRAECQEALRLAAEQGVRVPHLADVPEAELPRLMRTIPAPWNLRLRHVVTETHRTRSAGRLLARQDLAGLGRLLVDGHRSLRDDYQSTIAEADFLVDVLVEHGALGARLTGAGWGGAVIALLPPERAARIAAEVGEAYRAEFGRLPDAWRTPASEGVRTERLSAPAAPPPDRKA